MDQTAISLCKETKLPIICFDFNAENAISGLLQGQTLGTIIASEDWNG
jgi:uridylate kinase